jgi:hypothetical protein
MFKRRLATNGRLALRTTKPEEPLADVTMRRLNEQLASWGARLANMLSQSYGAAVAPEERRKRLLQVAVIETELEKSLASFEQVPSVRGMAPTFNEDATRSLDAIRDLLVRVRVALRAPDHN